MAIESSRAEVTDRHLQLLIATVTDYAIFLLDPSGRIASWNPGAQRIKGWSAEEIVGEHFSRFYTAPDLERDHPAEELRLAARDGRFEEEGWRVRKDGTTFWASVVITALRDEHGTLVGYGKVTRDLSERREAEEALRAQTAQLRETNVALSRISRLVGGITDYAIFMLDPEGLVTTWNTGAEHIQGYDAEEIIGRPFSVFYTDADRRREHPADELRQAARRGSYEEEGWRVRKDGTRFWAGVVIRALRDSEGRLEGFAKVTRDLTERRAAAEALDETHRELERANEEMRIFSSAAAHDLREPLRTLAGFSTLLARRYGDDLPEAAQQMLAQMGHSVERMQELIDALLTFARTGAREVELGRVRVRDSIDAVVAGLGVAIAERRARITVEVPEEAALRADRPLIEVVLQNLVENALKFGRDGGPAVHVGAERRDGTWRVSVRDDGIGIAPADHEAVFEPFRRLHGQGEYRGSGLGLATCRRAIERQGGRVGVESEPGHGSTFWFELPAAA